MTSSPRVGFVSLGCPKAIVDSERILTQLRTDGYDISSTYEGASLVVVNTCGFIDEAKQESLDAIGEALTKHGKVIVTGCLGANEETIRSQHPQVLSVTGPQQYEAVLAAVHQYAPLTAVRDPLIDLVPPQGIKLTPRHYAYLKISEGCNNKCSFCIIPKMRGLLLSRPIAEVIEEATRLVDAGVKELLVISQDTSAYGSDIRYRTGFVNGRPVKTSFWGLCEALAKLGVWVRLHYVYPYPHVDAVVALMDDTGLLPYLDIPFQHASPAVLKRMRRPAAAEKNLERVTKWRETNPKLTIRSTFIVGFPGETDAEFEQLINFIREAQLDRVGCFEYSPVAGAEANKLGNLVPEKVKSERWHHFMQTQQEISRVRLSLKVGRILPVLVDARDGDGVIGRTTADAPEIDGVIRVDDAPKAKPGDFINVKVTGSDDYDLFGRPSPQ